MAITYTWNISQMKALLQAEGENNVIFEVDYMYTGSEESGGVTYTADFGFSSQEFVYEAGNPFVPYENTEEFENVVIGWLESTVDVAMMQSAISSKIQNQITPVDENLYFTWQES